MPDALGAAYHSSTLGCARCPYAVHAVVCPSVQVLTKFCCFGDSMRKAKDLKFVEQSINASRKRLGRGSTQRAQRARTHAPTHARTCPRTHAHVRARIHGSPLCMLWESWPQQTANPHTSSQAGRQLAILFNPTHHRHASAHTYTLLPPPTPGPQALASWTWSSFTGTTTPTRTTCQLCSTWLPCSNAA